MKIFKTGNYPAYLTVDSTLISVDSTEITVDATFTDTYSYELIVIPRFQPLSVNVSIKHELTDTVEQIVDPYFTMINGYLRILFNHSFFEGQNFEIKITDGDNKLLWRGKGYATEYDDLENYKLTPPDNNGIIII